jgi:CRISPR-associated protein Csc1
MQGKLAQKPVYLESDREQNLVQLNDLGIYVFPALPKTWSYQINTFKAAQIAYYGKSQKFGAKGANRNYPINYGRAKELAVGSEYCTYIVSREKIAIPQWIRLGKWSSKIKIIVKEIDISQIKSKSGVYICRHPLNPIDLSPLSQLLLYNRIVMPPSSLVSQAQLEGEYWELLGKICLPRNTSYGNSLQ